jgi:hypothetical protein
MIERNQRAALVGTHLEDGVVCSAAQLLLRNRRYIVASVDQQSLATPPNVLVELELHAA